MHSTLAHWHARTENHLEQLFDANATHCARLHSAMRYAALGHGKRIRPLLVYATGSIFAVDEALLDIPAIAIELIHTYSLVHDDLPAMDDDALRRGRPTVHIAFDEATAILAGDALQALAFEQLAQAAATDHLRLAWLQTLTKACGNQGMCAGQSLDMQATGQQLAIAPLTAMHALKTGALIRAAFRLGALAGNATSEDLERLDCVAQQLGLAFQIRDDILDVEASSEALGKTAGKDAIEAKSTFPGLLTLEGAKAYLAQLTHSLRQPLADYGNRAIALHSLIDYVIHRTH